MKSFVSRAFTTIELLAAITIVVVIAIVATVFVGNYIDYARLAATRHTVAVLNESLNEYRTLGGLTNGCSLKGSTGSTLNAATLTSAAFEAMKTGFTNFGRKNTFVRSTEALNTAYIASTGSGQSFRFVAIPTDSNNTTTEVLPSITVQPLDISGLVGSSQVFHVEAANASTYQWYFSNDGLSYSMVSDATSADLSFANIQASSEGFYYVKVSNNVGSINSTVVTVSVGLVSGGVTILASGLTSPWGITEGSDGYLYVTSYTVSGCIYRISKTGETTILVSGLLNPRGITEGSDGYLYVINWAGGVLRISKTGAVTQFASGLSGGCDIKQGLDGNFYTAACNVGISKISSAGVVSSIYGSGACFVGLDKGSSNALYAVSYSIGALYKGTTSGEFASLSSGIASAEGVAVGRDGYLYVTSQTKGIYRVALDGTKVLLASLPGVDGITVGSDGKIYASAYGNGCVYVLQ